MAEDSNREHVEHQRAQHAEPHSEHSTISAEEAPTQSLPAASYSLLGDPKLNQRGNAPVRTSMIQRMQQTLGNRTTMRFLQRIKSKAPESSTESSDTHYLEAGLDAESGVGDRVSIDITDVQRREASGHQEEDLGVRAMDTQVSETEGAAQHLADPNHAGPALAGLPVRGSLIQRAQNRMPIQRDVTGTPKTAHGQWDVKGIKKEGALNTPPTASGIDISLKFTPSKEAPYSNKIGIIQIVKLRDVGGADIAPQSLPALPSKRRKALLTADDKGAGVEGGFFTDVLHRDFGPGRPNKDAAQRSGQTQNYQGGAPVFGFKRSEDSADIKAAEITDFPGTTSKTANFDFTFETVARGDDVQQIYGGVKWAFGLRAGKVVSETGPTGEDTGSATFNAAVEKHRDFYTHEPVAFYFEFDSSTLSATEIAKIDGFLAWLNRNTDARLTLAGFADQRGKVSHNEKLARKRAEAVSKALRDKGVDPARINPVTVVGGGASRTADATTSQDTEANRRGNRAVTLTFERTPIAVTP